MKTDKQGCSTCPAGQEQYEFITLGVEVSPKFRGQKRVQYDYRTPEGVLFSTVSTSLEVARLKRDNWLKERGLKN